MQGGRDCGEDENIPYAEMVKGFKWKNRVRRGVNGVVKEGIVSIKWPLCSELLTAQKESGGRIQCRFYTIRNLEMVLHYPETSTWFECLLNGEWSFSLNSIPNNLQNWSWKVVWEWRKTPFKLSWWGPLADTKEERNTSSSTWIFKAIGDSCGGWLEIEEETTLRNHLQWERIRIRSEHNNIPREIKIESDGIIFEKQSLVELEAGPSDTGLCQLDPKDLLGLNTKVMEGPKQSINKNTPPKSWELTTFMETNGRSEAEIAIEETANMISQSKDCNAKDNDTLRQTEGESTPKTSDQSGTREVELQLQQVHQPEPVDMHISTQLEVTETKAPN
ncbi:hypothetical protein H5410_041273 [Solanum commersonii]|uniref:DUF4283 domain-containing protein n=1 Tax=Solanum commersonii TaxID=4109 RepID=A0A9J5XT63_SOLCO|nr:hypothetical protein H5410_041273 [Solanum commersonii]